MLKILRADSSLRPPFPTVFAEVSFQGDRSLEMKRHCPSDHFAAGWTAVLSLGRYDHTRGGHIVLWDWNVVVEMPPRSLFYFPSGVLRYSFLPVAPSEERCAIVFHSGGGLFLWAGCGYRPFSGVGPNSSSTGWERWQEAADLFSHSSSLAMDRP